MTYIPSKGETVQIIVKGGKVLTGTAIRINAKTATISLDAGRKCLAPFLWIIDPLSDDSQELQAKAIRRGGESPAFAVGDEGIIEAPHAPKWHGTHVKIVAVNRTRYKVKAANVSGFVNVPFRMVKAF